MLRHKPLFILVPAAAPRVIRGKTGPSKKPFIVILPPPPVQGLGAVAGFKLYIEDRAGMDLQSPYEETTSTLILAGVTGQVPSTQDLLESSDYRHELPNHFGVNPIPQLPRDKGPVRVWVHRKESVLQGASAAEKTAVSL